MYDQNDNRYPIAVIFIELNGLLLEDGYAKPKAVEMLNTLVDGTHCIILSSRSKDQKSQTMQKMKSMGFPVDSIEYYFKPEGDSLMKFRNEQLEQIRKRFLLGFGICLTEADVIPFDRCKYPTICFTEVNEFNEPSYLENSQLFEKTCRTWDDVGAYLLEKIQNISESKLEEASGLLVASASSSTSQKVETNVSVADLAALFEDQVIMPESEIDTQKAVLGGTGSSDGIFDRASTRAKEQEILDNAVFQQLFSHPGSDRILGKDDSNSIQIQNVEYLLNSFMAELKSKLSLVEERKIDDFFEFFTNRYELDLSGVKDQVETNLAAAITMEDQSSIFIYIVVTKLIEQLRNICFEHFGIGWIEWVYKESTQQPFEGAIREKFNHLMRINDPDVTLLYNVSFILWLTHIYPDTPFSKEIENIIQKHTKKVIGKLFL